MTFFVRRCLLLFIFAELFVFFLVYCFGPKGLKTLYKIHRMHIEVCNDISQLQEDIIALKADILTNQTDFAKEKIARERLLMKKKDEIIYFKRKRR